MFWRRKKQVENPPSPIEPEDEAPGTWTRETIAGHPCEVYEPPERHERGYVLLYLHGVHLGSLSEQMPLVRQFAKHGLPVVAPITQRSWWSDRICPEFDPQISAEQHVLENVLPFIEQRLGARPPRVGLFGTSMGGQGALRLTYKYPDRFPVVAGLAPAIDYHTRFAEGDETLRQMYPTAEAVRQNTAILHIHPLNWPRHQFFCCDPADARWHDSVQRLQMKLWSLGVPHECDLETTGGGHGFQYYNHMAPTVIDFLVASLDKERLRVV